MSLYDMPEGVERVTLAEAAERQLRENAINALNGVGNKSIAALRAIASGGVTMANRPQRTPSLIKSGLIVWNWQERAYELTALGRKAIEVLSTPARGADLKGER